ncbi:MarR family winged helix-turn-helix transcriptional regulator [Nonomuraea muscovyensis]|uniref:DNA-binding MarR family transcriptional regulator n=1 Tax=Nonomuraea muscovyensis TaxID=1124761 RepID=A0A7X0C0H6_9ACTN|nr:MarR family transcriptional regulator [Nonomuraea muscovyensis]MBB6345953.1 DNA-binding MarR family transcriptional regulator [Nonomuraea muscovyensis]MDF2711558.1 MarR family transcriptional regulator [Nonomuraea muscovyensis]
MSRDISDGRKKLLEALSEAGRDNSNAAVMYHTAMGERIGLGMTEEKALDLLQRLGPLTAGEVSQHTGLAPASVSGLIDRLERKWLVRRVRDPKDRRRVIVEINFERLAGFAELFEPLVRGLSELYERYTDEELAVILDFLTRATAVQRSATAELTTES